MFQAKFDSIFSIYEHGAFDKKRAVYLSELDNAGKPVSNKVYNVALSRLIYAFAYSSQFIPKHLDKAKQLADFQLARLLAQDEKGEYFLSFVAEDDKQDDKQASVKGDSDTLDIWQQAYGLCGLSELYRVQPDPLLLKRIHSLHKAFIARFQDRKNGGFWGAYKKKHGPESGSKSLQALMYPITAYLANLWLADVSNRSFYENAIKQNIELASRVAWNTKRGWVNVKFDDAWQVCEDKSPDQPCFMVSPGHNFQIAALFLRTRNFDFISDKDKVRYKKLGLSVLKATLDKKIMSGKSIADGFFSELNPETEEVHDRRKTWWQHAEAIIALSLCGKQCGADLERATTFFFKHFVDTRYGGEFFYLDADNSAIVSELKGSIGKSSYHTIEMMRFLHEI